MDFVYGSFASIKRSSNHSPQFCWLLFQLRWKYIHPTKVYILNEIWLLKKILRHLSWFKTVVWNKSLVLEYVISLVLLWEFWYKDYDAEDAHWNVGETLVDVPLTKGCTHGSFLLNHAKTTEQILHRSWLYPDIAHRLYFISIKKYAMIKSPLFYCDIGLKYIKPEIWSIAITCPGVIYRLLWRDFCVKKVQRHAIIKFWYWTQISLFEHYVESGKNWLS